MDPKSKAGTAPAGNAAGWAAAADSGPRGPEQDQAWAHFRQLLDHRHYEEAEETCKRGLEEQPGDFRWRLGLSLALLGARKNELALRLALTLVNDRPDHPESYRTLALAWLGLGKKEIALEWANLARQKSPTPEYTRFVERMRRTSGVESPPRAAPDEAFFPDDEPEEPREQTRIVNLATLKAAVAAPAHERQNELVTQIFQRETHEHKPALPPNALLEAQIHRLFGASLFGVWDTSTREILVPAPHAVRKAKDRRRLYLGLATAVAVGLAAAVLVRTGVKEQSRRAVVAEVEALSRLIESGALPQAAEILPKVETTVRLAGQAQQHQPGLVRAQAVLYRHHDAAPERRAFVEAELASGRLGESDAQLIRALLYSWEERALFRSELEALRALRPKDPEVAFLLATAHDAAKDEEAATELYKAADELEPAYLPHAAFQVDHALRRQAHNEMMRMVEMMRDVHPMSPWTHLAVKMLPPEEGASANETSSKSAANPIGTPPVVEAELLLLEARRLLATRGLAVALPKVDLAVMTLKGDPTFMLDFATRLADGAPTLAAHLTTLPTWPKDAPAARTLLARLQSPVADATPTRVDADPAPDRRPTEPVKRPTKRKRTKRRGR